MEGLSLETIPRDGSCEVEISADFIVVNNTLLTWTFLLTVQLNCFPLRIRITANMT